MVAATLFAACAPQERDALAIMMQHESEFVRCSRILERNNELVEESLAELESFGTRSMNSIRETNRRQAFVTEHFDNCWAGWKKTVRAHFEEAGLGEEDFEAALGELKVLHGGKPPSDPATKEVKQTKKPKAKDMKVKEGAWK